MIAEFMGYKPESMIVNFAQPDGYTRAKTIIGYQIEKKRTDGFQNLTPDYMLKYHTSWDLLIPAISELNKKLKDTSFKLLLMHEISSRIFIGNIKGAYEGLVRGIEWYNEIHSYEK